MSFEFNPFILGTWSFLIRACVDRRTEAFNGIDCSIGEHVVKFNLQEASQPDPVDPDTPVTDPVLEPSDSEEFDDIIDTDGTVIPFVNSLPYLVDFDPFIVFIVNTNETELAELP